MTRVVRIPDSVTHAEQGDAALHALCRVIELACAAVNAYQASPKNRRRLILAVAADYAADSAAIGVTLQDQED